MMWRMLVAASCVGGVAGVGGVGLASLAHADPAPLCVNQFGAAQRVSLTGNVVRFCDGRRKQPTCYAADLSTGASSVAAPPVPSAPTGPKVETGDKSVKVCAPDGKACKTLTPKGRVEPGLGIGGEANEAGTLAAVINQAQIETFELKTGKRIAAFKAGDKGVCSWVTFVGEALVVSNSECGDGAGTSWIATTQGKQIARVGGDQPIDAIGPVVLGGSRAAFASRDGDVVVVQDLASGVVAKRISVGAAVADTRPTLVGDAHRAVLVFGGARAGDVVAVNLDSDKISTYPAQRCP